MKPIMLRFEPVTIESLDAEADEHDMTRAEYVRYVVRNRHDADRVRDEYEAKLAQLRDDHETTTD